MPKKALEHEVMGWLENVPFLMLTTCMPFGLVT